MRPLVLDWSPGVRCVLLETHEPQPSAAARMVQNLHTHIHLGEGAVLQHLRMADAAPQDHLAHTQNVHVAWPRTLPPGPGGHRLRLPPAAQRWCNCKAPTPRRHAGLLLPARTMLDHQSLHPPGRAHTDSHVRMLALASRQSACVANAFTYIAPGARDANVRQRLWGVALDGQPRLILRPHLEILHDQVQAVHGATWGRLPEDALFYALQRGLDEATPPAP
jgi:Fe-S cluster assembly protein SufD